MPKVDLHSILADARVELQAQQAAEPLAELHARLADVPAPVSIRERLVAQPSLIAEIKVRSPSMGDMRSENVAAAPAAYRDADFVQAISVLTNEGHFGGHLDRLVEFKKIIGKPVLRKDFIVEEYQVIQSRAYGADALLLMVNAFEDVEKLHGLYDLAKSLGMDALVETHDVSEIEAVAGFADWMGINSRNFKAKEGFDPNRQTGDGRDVTTDLGNFDLVKHVPDGAVKIAESGIHTADDIRDVFANGFNAALVGTALLMDEQGPAHKLAAFGPAFELH